MSCTKGIATLFAVVAVAAATAGCGARQGGPSGPPADGEGESLSAEAVQGVVREHEDQVQGCYRERLAEVPDLTGRLDVRMTIAPDGTIREVEVEDNGTGDEPVAECVLAVIRSMRFPEATAASMVTYPFVLQPAEAADAPRPEISGEMAPEAVRGVIREHVAGVRACYEAALVRSASTQGRVVVRFTATPAGAVEEAAVTEDTTGDGELSACVTRTVQGMTFPASSEATTITYPFLLMPGEGEVEASAPDGPPEATAEGIRAAISAHSSDLEGCRGDGSGQVDVRFTVAPDGSVASAEAAANTTGSDEVATCLLGVVRRLRFAPSAAGTTATFPIQLAPPAP